MLIAIFIDENLFGYIFWVYMITADTFIFGCSEGWDKACYKNVANLSENCCEQPFIFSWLFYSIYTYVDSISCTTTTNLLAQQDFDILLQINIKIKVLKTKFLFYFLTRNRSKYPFLFFQTKIANGER